MMGGLGIIFHPLEGKDYTWYISGIYYQVWVIIYYLPPFTKNLKNPWRDVTSPEMMG